MLYLLYSTSVLSFYIDVVLTLSIAVDEDPRRPSLPLIDVSHYIFKQGQFDTRDITHIIINAVLCHLLLRLDFEPIGDSCDSFRNATQLAFMSVRQWGDSPCVSEVIRKGGTKWTGTKPKL